MGLLRRTNALALVLLCWRLAAGKGHPVEAGTFLVADGALIDPNFAQTVVLVVSNEAEGTLGLVINRRTDLDLSGIISDRDLSASCPCPIQLGGPIATDSVLTLVRTSSPPKEAKRIFGNVYITTLDDGLAAAKKGEKVRFYAGHAGWGNGQLADEIGAGAWRVVPGNDRHVFDTAPERLWTLLGAKDIAERLEDPEVEKDPLALLADLDNEVERRGLARRRLAHEAAQADPVLHRHDRAGEAAEELLVVPDHALVDSRGDLVSALLQLFVAV